jgi:hypothetical protein
MRVEETGMQRERKKREPSRERKGIGKIVFLALNYLKYISNTLATH